MTLSLRRATPADAETLARFNEAMALETEDKTLDPATIRAGVQALLDDPARGFYLLAESTDGAEEADDADEVGDVGARPVVGGLMITTEWSDWRNGTFWWVQSVYVRPDARRQGVYSALYARVRTMAREADDVCGLRLYVEKSNVAARETYDALGMTQTAYRMYEDVL